MLVTCVQVLYLESLRIRTRERASLEFFKETLESRLGLETERGCAHLFAHQDTSAWPSSGASRWLPRTQNAPGWEALAVACLLGGDLRGDRNLRGPADRVSQEHRPRPPSRSFRCCALLAFAGRGRWCGRWNLLQSLFELGDPVHIRQRATRPDEHIEALILAGEEEGIIEKGDRELIQSVVAFGDKTVREVMTPRPLHRRHPPGCNPRRAAPAGDPRTVLPHPGV